MKLLVLGGTIFLGRHLVASALAAGHEVTLFNRGRHNPDLFPEVEHLRGDRDQKLSFPAKRRWDAVIDTCGYFPRQVRASAGALADRADHYTFISSISVYGDINQLGIDESTPVATTDDLEATTITNENYGPLKALCEQAAEETMPGRVLNVRPGLIVGPHDPSDRFTYWPDRVARGGDILAPGSPAREIQFIDVRDLADWILRAIEGAQTGVFNATGPEEPLTMLGFLETCRHTVGSAEDERDLVWVDDDFLVEKGVAPYTEIPLWIPGEHDTVNCRRAMTAGLSFRLVEETIQDTLRWDIERRVANCGIERRCGLSPERETELLRAYATKA